MPDREHEVREAFVALADTLADDLDVMDQLVWYCVRLLAAESAGILLGDARGGLRAVACSSDTAEALEGLQVQVDQGPCPDSFSAGAPVSIPDISQAADRWPQFVDVITRAGFAGSVHALPLRYRGRAVGALNLFHRHPGPLPGNDLSLAQSLADVATVTILSRQQMRRSEELTEQLQSALVSRVVIEQAKGALSRELGISTDAAFARLRDHARSTNARLSDVARRTVDGELAGKVFVEQGASGTQT